MMKSPARDFLKKLLQIPSPSGFETRGQHCWIDYVKPLADKVEMDSYGNALATIHPQGNPKILLAAHMDEIGMMVSYIAEEGFLYFQGIGGIDQTLVRGQHVTIHTKKGPVAGVTGLLAIHLQEPDDRKRVPPLHEMYIDIGASSRREAEKLVALGDPITYSSSFQELANDCFAARGCDNRIGAWAVAQALRIIAKNRKKLQASVVALSTIQEENGLYGATMAAHSIHPDVALVVDVTHATDIPSCSKPKHGDIRLGKGPVISLGSTNHPPVNERLCSIAQRQRIAFQVEVNPRRSGTDADAIFSQRGGIPTISLGVPNRYMHSPVEMIHFSDLKKTAELLAAFALTVKRDEQFGRTLHT